MELPVGSIPGRYKPDALKRSGPRTPLIKLLPLPGELRIAQQAFRLGTLVQCNLHRHLANEGLRLRAVGRNQKSHTRQRDQEMRSLADSTQRAYATSDYL
jgi:hypothetical protein